MITTLALIFIVLYLLVSVGLKILFHLAIWAVLFFGLGIPLFWIIAGECLYVGMRLFNWYSKKKGCAA